MPVRTKSYKNILFIGLSCIAFSAQSQTNVLTQHYDQSRTGWYNQETTLTGRNVKYPGFGKLFTRAVDDQVYAQPLIVNVKLPSGNKNVVIVATVNNSIYAFDADSAKITQPYWQINLTPAGNRAIKNTDMTGACGGGYRDFSGNMGIVGTPVIDPATSTLYVVSRNVNPTTLVFQQFLHAINLLNGSENAGSPVLISASVAGTGDGGSTVNFDPQKNNQRPGLLLLNGVVYIAWSSHCDWTPYHGWVIGYDATSLQRKYTYCSTPDGYEGGIWMSGSGPAADNAGNIYLAVGNGSVGKNGDYTNLRNRAESALKLTPSGTDLTIDSYFSPSNIAELEAGDLDFGVTEMLLIPNTNQAIVGCKDGNLYLLDRDNMGGYQANANSVVQNIDLGANAHLHSSLAYYKGTQNEFVYTWSENSVLKALAYDRGTNQFNIGATINSGAQGPSGNNGAVMSVSSNGSIDSTAVLWASHAANGDANQSVRPGILRALDANDVTRELWNSSQTGNDNPGTYAKFVCPVIANGKVYLATFSNQLVVYGLNSASTTPCPTGNLGLNKTSASSSGTSSNAFDGNVATPWSSSTSDAQSISVDLGQRYDLCSITLRWGAKYGVNFQLQYSDDNTNWSSLVAITGNAATTNSYPVSGTGEFVRLVGTLGQTGYILNEFEITGSLSAVQCATPFVLPVTNIYENSATLNWTGANSFFVQYKTPSAGSWTQLTTTNDSLSLKGLACGTDYLFRLKKVCSVSDSSSYSVSGAFSTLPCNQTCDPLPTRWISLDIGDVGIAGSACYLDGLFTMKGSGNDIWDVADAFRFAYKNYTGDGDYYIRVATMDHSDPWNKCGIMFRESLAEGSRNVVMAITSGNGAAFQYRSETDGTSNNINTGGTIQAPYWVKISKAGSVYTGYASPDGTTWTPVGSVDAGFGAGEPIYAGLALSSHNNEILSTATLDNLYISGSFDYSLQSFTASLNVDKTVTLDWVTTVESNLEKFTVEHSVDNVNFTDIATLAAANQGHYTQEYSTKDTIPVTGINYYKLRMMTVVGIVQYSALASVVVSEGSAPSVFPNPATPVTGASGPRAVYVTSGNEPVKFVNIYDLAGRVLLKITATGTSNVTEIPVSSLSNGIYIVEIRTAHSTYKERLIVVN
jgi:hypothetical protein